MSPRRAALLALPVAFAGQEPARAEDPGQACEPADLAALAGWSGIWISEGKATEISGRDPADAPAVYRLAGLEAPWNDEGWGRLRAMLAIAAAGRSKIVGFAFPMMMDSPSEFKFLIAPAETAIISQYRDVRYVYTDGRTHPPEDERWATTWGDSVGCWHGDTLTIDTVGVRFDPAFNYWAPPLSEAAHFVERLRLVAPDRIEGEMTITDPVYLTGPWTVALAYNRVGGMDRLVHDGETFDNDRSVIDGDVATIAPPKDEQFQPLPPPPEIAVSIAELDRVVGRYTIDGTPLTVIVERRGERLYYSVPPVQPTFLPEYAVAPMTFESFVGGRFRFIADANGQVTGFEGTAPDGSPASGKRLAP